ncbi:DNA-binding protein [Campylobacter hyointestinalis]|uniref:DNA-binding protein n=1 Tax=Campylobacter hyointestinalis TaxID=198 RepID=A0A562XEE4_CAMHY|nr:DNA-binding protein [Campylobacter hyointestinalis]RAZ24282.1 DNA-binding protein [Campylobacter hyointestinalis subsp. lawsonii]RAZ37872.1 DNA-binding protein [Campylobacter hyointestinalis subsp. lawsonii]RAZ61104.1 DNA-binding protein [Campylobacter hyointestinalis subsp. lawsonii]TWO20479.1 DNA-binding protein [Campylobacter hyointestinalis]
MKRVPINEAAQILGITKEAIYNRIRRKSLKSEEKDGVKYVILDDEPIKPKKTDNFTKYLLSQIASLKLQNERLLEQKDKLVKEKEEIIITKIEELKAAYQSSDERLRAVLSMAGRSFKALDDTQMIEAEVEEIGSKKWLSLSEFLSNLKIKEKKLKKLQIYLLKCIGKKKFIKFENGIIYVRSNLDYDRLKEKI